MKLLIILHRYLGVLVGILMTLWCLSGFVMMYSPFPRLDAPARLQGMEALRLQGCCDLAGIPVANDTGIVAFRIEMLGGTPVLRLQVTGAPRAGALYDVRNGAPIDHVDAAAALRIARHFAAGHSLRTSDGAAVEPHTLGLIDVDQWTLENARGRVPLHHLRFDDAAATELYVLSSNGEILQRTTRSSRFWGWLGAVPHWLYPTVLRQNVPLWSQVVIWSSLLGCFLTVTGIYLGVVRFTQRRRGHWSPYLGLWKWHHLGGLFFGVLTLTWAGSGLLTMQPWGLFETRAGLVERQQLAGPQRWGTVKDLIASAATRVTDGGSDTVQVTFAPLGGAPYALLHTRDGATVRVDANGVPVPLEPAQLTRALAAVGPLAGPVERLDDGDDYYYAHHHVPLQFPVYRAVLADAQRTRLYLDAATGGLLSAFDRPNRQYRWWMDAPHRLDFAVLRSRPLWDVVMWGLLGGVTFACFTGAWMSLRRIRRDLTPG